MTTELLEFSPKRSETRSEEPRTPTLDLVNVLTLAEDIAAEPDGRSVKRAAGQIVEDCERDDMAAVGEMAQAIRETSDVDERANLAGQIVETVTAILQERDAEAAQVEMEPVAATV
jgi:hypothetical protein